MFLSHLTILHDLRLSLTFLMSRALISFESNYSRIDELLTLSFFARLFFLIAKSFSTLFRCMTLTSCLISWSNQLMRIRNLFLSAFDQLWRVRHQLNRDLLLLVRFDWSDVVLWHVRFLRHLNLQIESFARFSVSHSLTELV